MDGYPDLSAQIANLKSLLEELYRDRDDASTYEERARIQRTIDNFENQLKGLKERLKGFDGMSK